MENLKQICMRNAEYKNSLNQKSMLKISNLKSPEVKIHKEKRYSLFDTNNQHNKSQRQRKTKMN
jgi:hypothetical protein